jgi:hypothetical protein
MHGFTNDHSRRIIMDYILSFPKRLELSVQTQPFRVGMASAMTTD